MITGEAYVASLHDGRAVWLDGKKVPDVTTDPLLRKSIDWVASTYDRYAGAENPMFGIPRTQAELREQIELLLASDRTAATTAGVMALTSLGYDALDAYAATVRERDIRVAAAVDDTAKPVHVEAERDGGVVLSGGKHHVLGAAVVHELLVVAGDVACAVPLNAGGVRVIAHTPAPRADDDRHFPYSRSHTISEAIVVFDDVFVPAERVFRDAAAFPDTLTVWERARAVADQADRAELILGLAQTISEMNGIETVSHVRDKLSAIAVYSKMCRAGWESALANAQVNEGGMVLPDDSYLYATKAYGGHLYSEMTHYLHDVAGGAVITAPTIADLDNPEIGDYLRKYMRTMEGVSGEDRTRIFHIIRDLFADTYGGWDKVTNQVVGGGMHHQRMAALDSYDLGPVKARARAAAGIG
ncbi:MAG TPA: 4-hydroxyphenylacetate 3-hydroxylase C-terminal domain-containing protein [Acidimicrobiales bacterium]|nr:4-hydroxyphenylacetate 3-hydroxylase C-terminal domain-containing protein [Acidimicrobiales bacterium]